MSEKDDLPLNQPEEVVNVRPHEAKASSGALAPTEVAAKAGGLPEGHEIYKHPVLTDLQIMEAEEKAEQSLKADQVKTALKAIEAAHTNKLRQERGMVVGGRSDDMVTITLDLAEHSACLTTNGRPYWHGQTYTVPRHVADDLRSRMFMGWRHQNDIDGKSLTQFYQRHRNTTVSPRGTTNAPAFI